MVTVTTWVSGDHKAGQILAKILNELNDKKLIRNVSSDIGAFHEMIKTLKVLKRHKTFWFKEAHRISTENVLRKRYPIF